MTEFRESPMPEPSSSAPLVSSPAHSKRRRRLFRLLAAAIPFAVLWGIPEAAVRFFRVPVNQYTAIRFGGDPNSSALFIKDPRLQWAIRPNADVEFLGERVRTDKRGFRGSEKESSDRIALFLGDSTTFGWRIAQDKTFAALTENGSDLSDGSGGSVRALNAGVPGYSSRQVLLQAERLLPRVRPDIVIVCIGNNETWAAESSDAEIGADRRWSAPWVAGLRRSRALSWAADRLGGRSRTQQLAPPTSRSVLRVDLESYRENLRAIVRLAGEAGARVIVLSPTVNLMEPPLGLMQYPEWPEWRAWYDAIEPLFDDGKWDEALELIRQTRGATPDDFFALWVKGFALAGRGDLESARETLEDAFELQAFGERAKRSYRGATTDVAVEEGVEFLDVNEALSEAAGSPLPSGYFQDGCHPTVEGHAVIAEALGRMLRVTP